MIFYYITKYKQKNFAALFRFTSSGIEKILARMG